MSLYARVRQWWCSHHVFISQIEVLARTGSWSVRCPCNRCGKVLTAPYGIALPARFDPEPVA